MGPRRLGERQSLSLLPMVPLATPLVVGVRAEFLWHRCQTPRPIFCGSKVALLLAW
jgi:hypothetical protein